MRKSAINKRVLVTGGHGFLGHHLVGKLQQHYKCIIAPTSQDYNLTSLDHIKDMLDYYSPDIVLHLAAMCGGIGANQQHPGKFFYNNAIMGLNLIEESRKCNVEKFVCVGTICAYPKFTPVPFQEEDLWDGYPEETNAPYGLAKKMLLTQLRAYRDEYNFNGVYLLPVNMYGPRDNFDLQTSHVIPAIIHKCALAKENNDDSITLWGDGSVSREFLYVEDCAEAIILALKKYNKGDPINIGSGIEITIRDLAYKIKDIMQFDGEIVWDVSKPNGQPRRCLDVTKAEREFKFKAKTSFDVGLRQTIEWFNNER